MKRPIECVEDENGEFVWIKVEPALKKQLKSVSDVTQEEDKKALVTVVVRTDDYSFDVAEHDRESQTKTKKVKKTLVEEKGLVKCECKGCDCYMKLDEVDEHGAEYCGLHYECECGGPVDVYGEDYCSSCIDFMEQDI